MDSQVNFDINEAIKGYDNDPSSIATPEAPRALQDFEHEPETLQDEVALINSELNSVIDAITDSPEAITRSSHFDTLQFLLKFSSQIPSKTLGKILDLIGSALFTQANAARKDIEAKDQDALQLNKTLLEMYAFLFRWTISAVETKETQEKPAAAAPAIRGRGKGAKSKAGKDTAWDASAQIETALDKMTNVLRLELGRIFVTTSERDTFIGLLTKPVYHILENSARVKNTAIRKHSFRALCIAVKHHGHAHTAQISITQALFFYDHLSEAMAELLHILATAYDYPQLAEDVLREVSTKEFSSTDRKGPTSVSAFLIKISELLPQYVINQMALLANLLDSESYNLRMATIDVLGNLVIMISKQSGGERNEDHSKKQKEVYLDVLEERFRDVNPYCRARVMQVYVKLCDLEEPLSKRRQKAARYAAKSLQDKSSNVRRNAIKLLSKLVVTHCFGVIPEDQRILNKKSTEQKLEKYDADINALMPPEVPAPEEPTLDEEMLQDATQVDSTAPTEPKHPDQMSEEEREAAIATMRRIEQTANAEALDNLKKIRKYYADMYNFIEVVEDAAETVMQLLSAKNKSEVIEAMDFITTIHAYKLPNAQKGTKRMLRLIWTKGNSDEGKGVQAHLIECYRNLFFIADSSLNANATAEYIMHNMITLTYETTPAELTSLEQLLSTMMKQGLINDLVIQKLWAVYGYTKKNMRRTQRRGAIIILGMLALAKPEIIVEEMELCLRIGLGHLGREDYGLARYTCIALRRISLPPGKHSNTTTPVQVAKLPNDHAVLVKLAAFCEIVSDEKEWYGVAEQAISAIYVLSKHPDVMCSEILRRKTKHVFAPQAPSRPMTSASDAEEASQPPTPMEVDAPETPLEALSQSQKQNPALALSQLLFIVGHVAIKQIVHLELCEGEFKRRKAEKEKKTAQTPRKSLAVDNSSPVKKGRKKSSIRDQTPAEEVDELDLMAGTTEDDFAEHMARVREQELLYGPQSLLANFGPLVSDICHNPTSYNHPTLQAQAALCLAKLMCVSADYCASNLDLLLAILEQSTDAVVRSNLVVAIGDMALCFNHLIDERTDSLYRRLNDDDPSVKRTCLMTLTFLILASQIKVKGQLAQIAKCMEDSDDKIKDMARMFFNEYGTKENTNIYNQFIDVFSILSTDSTLGEDAFKRIIKTLAGYITRQEQAKKLAKKLADRLPKAENEKQWNDTAFTLGQLQHKEEEISKVVAEGYTDVRVSA